MILNFVNKFNIKNKGGCHNTVISTATRSSQEYMKSIEDKILPYWEDKELMRKAGINNLFADGAKVKKNLSYDDACDCLNRAARMIAIGTYVCDEFGKRSDEMKKADSKSKEKFYTADTILELFVEAQNNVVADDIVAPVDINEAIERINSIVSTFSCVKNITFMSIVCFANTALTEMTGFTKK